MWFDALVCKAAKERAQCITPGKHTCSAVRRRAVRRMLDVVLPACVWWDGIPTSRAKIKTRFELACRQKPFYEVRD
jgi:hypothetical protein